MQGSLANADLVESAFDLVNDAVLFLNTNQEVTKANKSAEIIFNMTSQLMVGRAVTDVVGGAKGDAMLGALKDLATGGKSHSCLLKQSLTVHRATQDA